MSGSSSAHPQTSIRYPAALAALIFALVLMWSATHDWAANPTLRAGTSYTLGVFAFTLGVCVAALAIAMLIPGVIAHPRRWAVATLIPAYGAVAVMFIAAFTIVDGFVPDFSDSFSPGVQSGFVPDSGTAHLWTALVAALGCAVAMTALAAVRHVTPRTRLLSYAAAFASVAAVAAVMTWSHGYGWAAIGLHYTHGWIAASAAMLALAASGSGLAGALPSRWQAAAVFVAGVSMAGVATFFFLAEITFGSRAYTDMLAFVYCPDLRHFLEPGTAAPAATRIAPYCSFTPQAGAGVFAYGAASIGYLTVGVAMLLREWNPAPVPRRLQLDIRQPHQAD